VALAAVLAGLVVAAFVAATARGLGEPYRGWSGEAVVVDLPRGASAGRMIRLLADRGVVRDPGALRAWVVLSGQGGALHAGEYRFDRPISALGVLERLRRGDVLLHPVTLPEGLDLRETAARLAAAGLGEEEAFRRALSDPAPVRDVDPEAPDLEGYLFPDTYRFPRGETPEAIARALVAGFRRAAGADYATRARAVGLGIRQAVTLASLIEEETGVSSERARISRVFHNRLARGMLLQCDPTVLYALRRAGRTVGTLRLADLEIDSPWNTYRRPGLPPGPICNPGRPSLQAALAPAPGNELFFVAAPGGGHAFSSTLAAHNAAVRAWRRYAGSSR